MDAKIKFLDDFSLDRKLYWRVGDLYQRYQWEIVFDKGTPDVIWKIRRHGSDDWHALDVKNMFAELSARQVDVLEFDRQLSGNIMTQAVFSSSLLEEAKKILGETVILDAISNHNEFAEKLLEMIRDLTRSDVNDGSVSKDGFLGTLDATDRSLEMSSASSENIRKHSPKLDVSSAFKKPENLLRLVKNPL